MLFCMELLIENAYRVIRTCLDTNSNNMHYLGSIVHGPFLQYRQRPGHDTPIVSPGYNGLGAPCFDRVVNNMVDF